MKVRSRRVSRICVFGFFSLLINTSSATEVVGWDGYRKGLPYAYPNHPSKPYDAAFLSINLPNGRSMVYDQTYLVIAEIRNTGSNPWLPGEVSIVQDQRDLNWRASYQNLKHYVPINQRIQLPFLVKPEPCFVRGKDCLETRFRWRLMRNGQWFGQASPAIDVSVRNAKPIPSIPPSPDYGGMIFTPPKGGPPPPIPDDPFPLYLE